MGRTKWPAGIVLMLVAAGCGVGQAASNDAGRGGSSTAEIGRESTGGPASVRTLPCNASQQRAVDLDIEGPGRPSPEDAVAPFADGPTLALGENARAATVGVLGADGNLARVFAVSKHVDGWWPDGFKECTG